MPGYEAQEGYAALRRALEEQQPEDVTRLVKESNLRGRGGAGFPTGVKWALVPMGADAPRHKYIICNADEMEPGSFKDRLLMEGVPHQLVEGMILSGYAIQASRGYIFLRGEYVLAAERLNRAIAEARAAGYLGTNVRGTPWSFDLFVHTSAGRYICGEETALINALEGRRANPRAKPPFPQIAGLWGKPTVVNNVETLSNVPHIVLRGVPWFQGLSQAGARTRARSCTASAAASGAPACGNCRSAPAGGKFSKSTPGGMQAGLTLKCWLPGGASTEFLLPEHLISRWISTPSPRPAAHGHGLADRGGRQPEHPAGGAQSGAIFCARVLRLVHAVPRRPVPGLRNSSSPWSTARGGRATSKRWSR